MKHTFSAVVTGATGFLGSALIRCILDAGGKVHAVVRKDSAHRSLLPEHHRLEVVEGDLDDIDAWPKLLSGARPDVFYHLAWKEVGNSESDRDDIVQVSNIEPTVKTVRLARGIGCRRWIGTGSQAEYGPMNGCISEADATAPTTLYGASKLAACHLTRFLGARLDIETLWVRIFSLYGPRDRSMRLLDYVIDALLRGERPALTAGEQLWDYLHVDDAAEALRALGVARSVAGIYNLGSGSHRMIRSVVEMVRDMIDPRLGLEFGRVAYKPDQVMHLEADITKIRRDTGWHPRISLEEGVRQLVEYVTRERTSLRPP